MKHKNDTLKSLRAEIIKKAKDFQKDARIIYFPASETKEIVKEKIKDK